MAKVAKKKTANEIKSVKTTLTFGKKTMRGPALGATSAFPAMRNPIKSEIRSALGEDDGLFINYGMFQDSLPYTMQDNYDGEVGEQTFSTAVLENRFLWATFVLDLGGRLWSLYDKVGKRDLITDNPEFRPNNLAIRNAWFAGGIEYNIGRRGHDEQTCSPRFAARLADSDGTPVLRIYEFDRDRALPFQMDFFLPEDSRFLLARMRIMNVNDIVVPMYWWSNIAVPMVKGQRIVVPAMDTYANKYEGGSHFITKIPLPDGDGFDGTYPENFKYVRDYFFNIPEGSRKFETVISPDGSGFLFASTRRLQGRKLFVWGNSQGGRHWQRKLMGEADDYLEIQGGLAKTQQECLPMPPNTTWEWMEAYGAIKVPAKDVFGDWPTAVAAVSKAVDDILPEAFLDTELERTKTTFALKHGEVVFAGSGWGALEEERLGHYMTEHLDFGKPDTEQKDWMMLLKEGTMPVEEGPSGYVIQEEWYPLLKNASGKNWKTRFYEALFCYRHGDYEAALDLLSQAREEWKNIWTGFALENVFRMLGRTQECIQMLLGMIVAVQDDASLAKEIFKVMMELEGDPELMLKMCEVLSPDVHRRPFIRFCHAYALAHCGRLDEALRAITANGGLEIPDILEGEISISSLYIYIQKELAAQKGKTLDDADVKVPFALDLRMS